MRRQMVTAMYNKRKNCLSVAEIVDIPSGMYLLNSVEIVISIITRVLKMKID